MSPRAAADVRSGHLALRDGQPTAAGNVPLLDSATDDEELREISGARHNMHNMPRNYPLSLSSRVED
jgi:hypothetical protein